MQWMEWHGRGPSLARQAPTGTGKYILASTGIGAPTGTRYVHVQLYMYSGRSLYCMPVLYACTRMPYMHVHACACICVHAAVAGLAGALAACHTVVVFKVIDQFYLKPGVCRMHDTSFGFLTCDIINYNH